VVRDNLRQRRAIERSYVQAIRGAQQRIDLAVPYFYPGRSFNRALRQAARRGVQVRLLLQGKVDYRIAGLAARVLYDELRADGVRIFEYTPAFLHAKVAVVDGLWATVGSSNIDPLSLLLNLEANVVVRDAGFARALSERFEAACAQSSEVSTPPARAGWRGWRRCSIAPGGRRSFRWATSGATCRWARCTRSSAGIRRRGSRSGTRSWRAASPTRRCCTTSSCRWRSICTSGHSPSR
jgi:cardiolipin synthase